ncbi:13656_t:CDS:2, partial [Dentiscutata erythropus]
MSIASSCGTLPPVKSDYVPKGVITNVSGLDVYCIVPDSFAETQTKNAGNAWTPEKFEKFKNEIHLVLDWLEKNAPPEKVHQLTTQVVDHLRKEYKIQNFGFIGYCWGGMIASKHSKDPTFDACVLIHPGLLSIEDFKESQCPIAFLPSKDEPDLESQYVKDPVLTSKPFASKIVHHRFDMHHGFAGSKGDFKDPVNIEAVNKVVEISVKFLNENLG